MTELHKDKHKRPQGGVLITGADGYLGQAIVEQLIAHSNSPLYLWMRATSQIEIATKKRKMAKFLNNNRCKFYFGDLNEEQPFKDINKLGIFAIIHTAAVTNFAVDANTAHQVNVIGTKKLLQFAEQCTELQKISVLSTIYVSGTQTTLLKEQPLRPANTFANQYDRSKYMMESMITAEFNHLPWQILRVATIAADDASGRVSQHNVFHHTLRLFYYGLLAVMPGDADTPIYLTTRQQTAHLVFTAFRHGSDGFYNLSADQRHTFTLAQLIKGLYSEFSKMLPFRERQILQPRLVDFQAFQKLRHGTKELGSVLSQAIDIMAPFAAQLYVVKQVENRRTLQLIGQHDDLDIRGVLPNICKQLVQSNWRSRLSKDKSVKGG
ncbi:NAD-dependent epimerase/dehydratase family protein [Thalassotalea sp. HSM 43]|uniref:SDR family oxidoreductase n=1 Tax=Thalassotalea sp. HSM 43 TaxID=2552945 RepID=UPI00108128F8|nr:SDR family oxidoreductase [Thalassotalea sp. HSM 43]QBY02951.1 NAD-dependent epimerase/dehydratase family protein [Thalassotalea sp. HSM 43]